MKLIKLSLRTNLFSFLLPQSRGYSSYSKQVPNKIFLNLKISKYCNLKNIEKNFSTSSCLMFDNENLSKEEKDVLLDETHTTTFTDRLYRHPGHFHNVLVIQPRDKSGTKWELVVDAEQKLAEAVALTNTLRRWKVVEKLIIPTTSLRSKLMFGTGNLEKIKYIIQCNPMISSVFVGVDIMTALQNASLEQFLGVQVFDRYQIILQIFHEHAHTKEAKLQLALAEIPYLKVKLACYSHTRENFTGIENVGGEGNNIFMEKRREILREREVKIKKALEKVKDQRQLLRNAERRTKNPIVAVVGYTNCGKTTLIKALSNDERLVPENKLFATLDVTLHAARLPSSLEVLFIDTVGFISNVPTGLIQSFKSTLEEIVLADLVIHVRDISHPDAENQKATVLKTLDELHLPEKLRNSILEVRNKCDLLDSVPENFDDSEAIYISATEGTGLTQFLEKAEEKLLDITDRSVFLIRVPNGGEEYRWLMKEGAIRDSIVDNQDQNYIILEVILSVGTFGKFKHRYGDMTIALEDIS